METEVGDDAGFLAKLPEAEHTPVSVGRFGGRDINRCNANYFVELLVFGEDSEEPVGAVPGPGRIERFFGERLERKDGNGREVSLLKSGFDGVAGNGGDWAERLNRDGDGGVFEEN